MPRTGTGRTFRRGATWWIDYSFRGKRYRESSESTKRSDATALLKKRLAEMGRGKLVGASEERVTFEDLMFMIVTDYAVNGRKSARRLNSTLAHLRDYFGPCRAIDVTTDRINSYIAQRQADGAANATIRQELAHLKRALNLAVQAEKLSSRPYVPSIRVSNTREGFFDEAELEHVLTELSEPVRAVVRFAAFTGWRSGEVLPLQWSQVNFTTGEVRLWTSKNDEPRVFPFRVLPRLAALLDEQRDRTRAIERQTGSIIPYVFHRDGKRIISIRNGWEAACKRAGFPGQLFHDLRRTAVRNLERASVPRSVAMKLTGHKTESVYRRYAIADSQALAEGVEKLARLHAASAGPARVIPIHAAGG